MELQSQRYGRSATHGSRGREINVGKKERNLSMLGGAALAMAGLNRMRQGRVLPALAMLAGSGMLFYRGKTGHCNFYERMGFNTAREGETGVRMEKVVTISRPAIEVYQFWRQLENLPRFMQHLDSVTEIGARTSRWRARGPAGLTVEWDAEMLEDIPAERISWHSLREAQIANEGVVEFRSAPGGRGTEVRVEIVYHPPGGTVGRIAAEMANLINARMLEEDLKRLKQILETGETSTAALYPGGTWKSGTPGTVPERQREGNV